MATDKYATFSGTAYVNVPPSRRYENLDAWAAWSVEFWKMKSSYYTYHIS